MQEKLTSSNTKNIQKTESMIMHAWSKNARPKVSIICITYNQESYIRDTIESFLMQETDFPFEIIIHDDASTDKTAEIINQFKKDYPLLIKTIVQQENQYSKINYGLIMIPIRQAIGDYIAVCEGDDYWTDPKKLQKQIKAMEEYPQCEMSFHPALKKNMCNQKETIMNRYASHRKIFTVNEIIIKAAGFCPTASMIFKKQVFDTIPTWLNEVPFADYFLQVFGSLKGGALYLEEIMSVYRFIAIGSWSSKHRTLPFLEQYFNQLLTSLKRANESTHYLYQKEFSIAERNVLLYMTKNKTLPIAQRKKILSSIKPYLTFKEKLLWATIYQHPFAHHIALKLARPLKEKFTRYD